MRKWICCHLGAREHYAAPRALHRRGQLSALVTDAWATPGSPWSLAPGKTGRRLSERYSTELAAANVHDFTSSLLAHEAGWRVNGLEGWPLAMARNQWFQSRAAEKVAVLSAAASSSTVVFAHSYAALEVFRIAKTKGLTCVLGQIDPGEAHAAIVKSVADRWPEFGPPLPAPPPEYFSAWREECRLADRIVVNSEWSHGLLTRSQVEDSKIRVIPLPYEAEGHESAFERAYPSAFTAERPLRVLFVGTVATSKGVPALLEALDHLEGLPIALQMVGAVAATIPLRFLNDPRIEWMGAVSRSVVMDHCRDADVLVFPSYSDGFGMAQVEAQGWRLPIIASRSCGRVVEDGVNGFLLPEVSAAAIASTLKRILDPAVLTRLATTARNTSSTIDAFGAALSEVLPNA